MYRDTVRVEIQGDTVRVWQSVYRDRVVRDTLTQSDTVRVVETERVETVKTERVKDWRWMILTAAVFTLAFLAMRIKRRLKGN